MIEPGLAEYHESKTGLFDDDCVFIGNGVEIETTVWGKSPKESEITLDTGRNEFRLAKQVGPYAKGVDIVKVHFVPKTSIAERANEPELVPFEEKAKIRLDAIFGFLSLAYYLLKDEFTIKGHDSKEDFYLYADTNPGFALFLLQNCGFRGSCRSGEVWIKRSEFTSSQNIEKMLLAYKKFKTFV